MGAGQGKLRVAALCCTGLYQSYMLSRLAQVHDLVGIVLYQRPRANGSLWERMWRYKHPRLFTEYVVSRVLLPRYEQRAQPLLEALFFSGGTPPAAVPPCVPCVHVGNINDAAAVEFVRKLKPDLICVNGTNLLRGPMLALQPAVPYGIINLHTGLSPYARGGNCNLYALLEGKPELVGVTIHHIDPGIDSGDIIITARPAFAIDDTYETIDARTFRLGIDSMLVAMRQLLEGRACRVPQWQSGKIYLRRTGYVYKPYLRVLANQCLKTGLVRSYLADRTRRDAAVRLVGELC